MQLKVVNSIISCPSFGARIPARSIKGDSYICWSFRIARDSDEKIEAFVKQAVASAMPYVQLNAEETNKVIAGNEGGMMTMVQLASAYSSIVNGGTYYLPHVVNELEDENGNTVREIDPTVLREPLSEETASTVRGYLKAVVDEGSGKTAKVDGYSMCGKTGTAEKFVLNEEGNATSQRADGKYLVSFIGSVPADDPEIVIYAVVDEPNVEDQAHSSYAQNLVREILKEALPYLNIYPDEEQTGVNADLDIIGEPNQTGAGQ